MSSNEALIRSARERLDTAYITESWESADHLDEGDANLMRALSDALEEAIKGKEVVQESSVRGAV